MRSSSSHSSPCAKRVRYEFIRIRGTMMQSGQADQRQANARVLVADDEESVAELLRRMLVKDGYTVEVVNDGLAALAAVSERKPHVVLLDVNMPGMNGIDVCRRIKQDLANRLTPVVLVTGMAQRE